MVADIEKWMSTETENAKTRRKSAGGRAGPQTE